MKRKFIPSILLALSSQFSLYAQQVMVAGPGAVITVQSNASMYVEGGIALDDHSKLYNEGSLTVSKTGTAAADFIEAGSSPYNHGNGKIIFSGAGVQKMHSTNQFGQIEINNGGLYLGSDANALRWVLNTGNINTGSYSAIVLSADADALIAGSGNEGFAHSWVNGNLRRYVDPKNVNSYFLPVGNIDKPFPARMDDLSANPLSGIRFINASFQSISGDDRGLKIAMPGKACTSVNETGVWQIVPDGVPVGGNYGLTFFTSGFNLLNSLEYAIVNRPAASYQAADWMIPVGEPLTGLPASDLARKKITSFGQFGIGVITRILPAISYTDPLGSKSLRVYPNPVVDNTFYIEYSGSALSAVKLLGTDGRMVACNYLVKKQGHVKVTLPAFLAKGIYTLEVETEKGLQSILISLQ